MLEDVPTINENFIDRLGKKETILCPLPAGLNQLLTFFFEPWFWRLLCPLKSAAELPHQRRLHDSSRAPGTVADFFPHGRGWILRCWLPSGGSEGWAGEVCLGATPLAAAERFPPAPVLCPALGCFPRCTDPGSGVRLLSAADPLGPHKSGGCWQNALSSTILKQRMRRKEEL